MMGLIDDTGCYATPDIKLSLNHLPLQQGSEFYVVEALLSARVDPETELKPPPVLLSFNGTPVFTSGNISLIIGKAKSMKTFFLCLVIARILGAKVEGIEIFDIKKVVFFDTEQSRYDVKRFIDRIIRLVGSKIKIDVFCLRPYSPSERKIIIDTYLQQNSDVSICFIDGVRDLVTDINSPDQATQTATWLMKLTDELNIHVCTVLHQNKGDNNARGHLGTELVNKVETTISITKDKSGGGSLVEPEYTRGREFDSFAFEVDEEGLPRIKEVIKSDSQGRAAFTPDAYDDEFHIGVLRATFNVDSKPTYSVLNDNIKVALQEKGIDLGNSRLRNFIAYYKKMGFITQVGTPNTRNAHYVFNQSQISA